MECTAHIVERQHAVLLLYVLDDLVPMFVIVELRAQHLIAQGETSVLASRLIHEVQFALTNVVAVVDEACQYTASEGKPVIVVLQYGTKLRLVDIALEFHPNRVFGIVEEYRRCLLALCYRLPIALYRLHTLAPCVGREQMLLTHIALCFVPDAVKLCTFDVHREVLVPYGQQFHIC